MNQRGGTILGVATGDCDPIYGGCGCGFIYSPIDYKKKKKNMHSRQIFATVTGSPAV